MNSHVQWFPPATIDTNENETLLQDQSGSTSLIHSQKEISKARGSPSPSRRDQIKETQAALEKATLAFDMEKDAMKAEYESKWAEVAHVMELYEAKLAYEGEETSVMKSHYEAHHIT